MPQREACQPQHSYSRNLPPTTLTVTLVSRVQSHPHQYLYISLLLAPAEAKRTALTTNSLGDGSRAKFDLRPLPGGAVIT